LACEMLRVVVFEYRLCVVAKSVGRPSLEGLVDRPTLAVGLFVGAGHVTGMSARESIAMTVPENKDL